MPRGVWAVERNCIGLRMRPRRARPVRVRSTSGQTARLGRLEKRGVRVIHGPVTAYHHEAGRIRSLTIGRTGRGRAHAPAELECEMVFVSTPKRPRNELAHRLGARADEAGYLIVDDSGRTSVTGIYAAGDATAGHSHQVTAAADQGATAATAVNYDLYDPVERGGDA